MAIYISKPSDINATLSKVAKTVKNGGGNFSGDEYSGRFNGGGVEGKYKVINDRIEIIITKKPLFAPDSLVEKKIREYFRNE